MTPPRRPATTNGPKAGVFERGAVGQPFKRGANRDERTEAGLFEEPEAEAVEAYDPIMGPGLSEARIDGPARKAPRGGERTGKSPAYRSKLGIYRSKLRFK